MSTEQQQVRETEDQYANRRWSEFAQIAFSLLDTANTTRISKDEEDRYSEGLNVLYTSFWLTWEVEALRGEPKAVRDFLGWLHKLQQKGVRPDTDEFYAKAVECERAHRPVPENIPAPEPGGEYEWLEHFPDGVNADARNMILMFISRISTSEGRINACQSLERQIEVQKTARRLETKRRLLQIPAGVRLYWVRQARKQINLDMSSALSAPRLVDRDR